MGRLLREGFIVCLLASCGSGHEATDRANAEKMATFIEAIGAAAEAGGTDCGKIAEGIEAVYAKDGAAMKELGPWLDSLDGNDARQATLAKAMMRRAQTIRPQLELVIQCEGDPRIAAAQARLKELMK
jgi:hypothetical protein